MQHDDQFIEVMIENAVSNKIAYNIISGSKPTSFFWMPGFLSNIRSPKVSALANWCLKKNYTLTRFNYSGRGNSEGRIEDGSITQWLEETKTVFVEKTSGPQILVGSSMGGWLALLLMKTLAKEQDRFAGCVLIAPAWNLTEELMWERYSPEIRKEIETKGIYYQPSAYGPYPITKQLIEDGRHHLIRPEELNITCPVTILQGMQDTVVPWQRSLELAENINRDDIVLELVKDGDHSLSRNEDIERLFNTLALMAKTDR